MLAFLYGPETTRQKFIVIYLMQRCQVGLNYKKLRHGLCVTLSNLLDTSVNLNLATLTKLVTPHSHTSLSKTNKTRRGHGPRRHTFFQTKGFLHDWSDKDDGGRRILTCLCVSQRVIRVLWRASVGLGESSVCSWRGALTEEA